MKVSESKYAKMVKDIRAIYVETGATLLTDPDDHGFNSHYKSEGNEIEFIFYWDGLNRVRTPDGTIIPMGSYGVGDDKAALEKLIERFGLEFVRSQNGMTGEQWNYYRATK